VINVPRQIQSEEEFLDIVKRANEVRVKRLRDSVKLKLRTPSYLYSYICDPGTAERLLAGMKIPVVDV
jgi:hypothetical protein